VKELKTIDEVMAVIAVKDADRIRFDPAEMLPAELFEAIGGCVKHDADSPRDRFYPLPLPPS
jgi:hypothetical protein